MRTTTRVEGAAPQTHSHTSERRNYEAEKERQGEKEKEGGWSVRDRENIKNHRRITSAGGSGAIGRMKNKRTRNPYCPVPQMRCPVTQASPGTSQ